MDFLREWGRLLKHHQTDTKPEMCSKNCSVLLSTDCLAYSAGLCSLPTVTARQFTSSLLAPSWLLLEGEKKALCMHCVCHLKEYWFSKVLFMTQSTAGSRMQHKYPSKCCPNFQKITNRRCKTQKAVFIYCRDVNISRCCRDINGKLSFHFTFGCLRIPLTG